MRILKLSAENYKRLVAVAITPDGHIVDINGKNGAGKSSTLDAIYAALAGKSALPSKPIRKGETKAKITLTLGEGNAAQLIVTRTFQTTKEGDEYTTSLTLEDEKGAVFRSPQTMLDGLLGALSFDPLAFTRMAAKDQLQQLRKLVPGVDFDAIDAANAGDYQRRTERNRHAKQLRAQLESLKVPGDPRVVRIDERALVAELNAAGERKAELERERARRIELHNDISKRIADAKHALDTRKAQLDRVEELREELAEMEQRAEANLDQAAKITAHTEQLQAELAALPALADPPDTAALMSRIDAARKTNEGVAERERAIERRAALEQEVGQEEAAAKVLTESIDKRNAEKAAAVSNAQLPIEGLGFGDNEALLNGLPLAQASDAEQLRVSVAIAAAMNPKLRVIRVRDGSLLDEDGLKLVAAFAEKHDLQIWLERVASNSPVGIRIVDGRVAENEAAS